MKQDYMSRLRRAARWMLLPEDATEVIADYTELSAGRSDEELMREVGDPVQAVRLVADTKEYHRWIHVFGVLAVCILLIPLTLRVRVGRIAWEFWPVDPRHLCWAAGLALTLWYRWKMRKTKAGAVPGALLLWLFMLLLAAAGMLFWQRNLFALLLTLSDTKPYFGQFHAMILGFQLLSLLCGGAGLFALVKVRMSSRRWLALFVLALTVEIACMELFLFSTGLNIDSETVWRVLLDDQAAAIRLMVIGIIAAGWALC